MIILPTRIDGEARYSIEIDLDEVTFNLDFEWNDRDQGWYMSIADVNGVALVSGRRVIIGYPLFDAYADARLPAGAFLALDTSDSDTEAGLNDLGDRVILTYSTEAEMRALST